MSFQPLKSPAVRVWKLTSSSLVEITFPSVQVAGQSSLNAISTSLPGGAYTTFRTYAGGKVLRLRQHLARLAETARRLGWDLSVDEGRLRPALHDLVSVYRLHDLRVRLTLDLEANPGDLFIAIQELHPPPTTAYRQGVQVVTCRLTRDDPQSKRTDFILKAEALRRSLAPGVEEALLLGPGDELLEGLSSNFYAVRAGQVWTAGESVLPGVTRSLLLECASQCNLVVHYQPVLLGQIASLDEAFITSSSREVMPVVRIDQEPVGNGRPGPLTRRLMACFHALVKRELQDI